MKKALGVLLLTLAVASGASAQDKKLVAVLDFDYGTVRSEVQAYFGSDQDVGKGISSSFLNQDWSAGRGKYRPGSSRNSLDKVLEGSKNFSNSDRANSSTAAKIGQHSRCESAIITRATLPSLAATMF